MVNGVTEDKGVPSVEEVRVKGDLLYLLSVPRREIT